MDFRTDLALERAESVSGELEGIIKTERVGESTRTTVIEVTDERGEKAIGKPKGKYITVEMSDFARGADVDDGRLDELVNCIRELLPENDGLALVAGIGNSDITPDALGPFTSSGIFSTRHISDELAKSVGFKEKLRRVAAVSTGVLGQTGLESSEYIKSIADAVKPACVITVDALAARSLSRLGKTVQLCNTGISPGSGIGNNRQRVDEEFIGVPVIAIGVPTVVDAQTLAYDIMSGEKNDIKSNGESDRANMIVTPKDIDLLTKNAADMLSLSINCALQPSLTAEEIIGLC